MHFKYECRLSKGQKSSHMYEKRWNSEKLKRSQRDQGYQEDLMRCAEFLMRFCGVPDELASWFDFFLFPVLSAASTSLFRTREEVLFWGHRIFHRFLIPLFRSARSPYWDRVFIRTWCAGAFLCKREYFLLIFQPDRPWRFGRDGVISKIFKDRRICAAGWGLRTLKCRCWCWWMGCWAAY